MNVLLLNAGSSSLKAAVMDSSSGEVVSQGLADWAGASTRYHFDGRSEAVAWKGHAKAVERFVADLPTELRSSLAAVGHRVVHGGAFTSPVRITPEIRTRIEKLSDLAPLHNPPSLETLAAAEAVLPDVPHIAVFDTAFHATLPPEAFTYPVPARWTHEWGIRRYGFHGLSHAYCARRAVEMLGRPCEGSRLVICHLGHGCSASAVRNGRCVDTTMGFTPLDGLMMATRSGGIDPGILVRVQERHGLTPKQIEHALNRESGLLGVSGVSADMREILAAAQSGNAAAELALAIYTHRVRQAIGALSVAMGGVDALVFTAGVGEHASAVREAVCAGLEFLGLELDRSANAACTPDADVATKDSRGRILVVTTREDITMLKEVAQILKAGSGVSRRR
jgi:acetate kinase